MRLLSEILPASKNNFGLIRLLAASSVVVSHAFVITGGPDAVEPLSRLTGYTLGQHAVNVFFFTSGLLVAASFERSSSLFDFAMARVLRIYPALFVCVVASAFIVGSLATNLPLAEYLTSASVYRWVVGTGLFVGLWWPLPGVFEQNPFPYIVDLPLWTLKYEIACYILLAGLGAVGILRAPRLFLSGFAALVLLFIATGFRNDLVPSNAQVRHMIEFAVCFGLGVSAYLLRTRLPVSGAWVMIGIALYLLAYHTPMQQFITLLVEAYGTLWIASLALGAALAVFRTVDLSYGVYIYGWPFAQLLVWRFPGISTTTMAVASLGLAAVVAFASWTFLEKPALRLKHRWKRFAPDLRAESVTQESAPREQQ